MKSEDKPAYKDVSLPISKRVDDLVSRMTLEEKVSQMVHNAAAIPRLDVPDYVWWNECLHGVARAGIATVFPQAIGLAATWNTGLIRRMAEITSTEARAKHHEALRQGNRGMYFGLTFWSPNVNIFRDPRWGRGQETYGECPYLTSRVGVEFVKGLQGDDPKYMKAASCAKHYAVHSGPEADRHRFDAKATVRDMEETYLPAFRALVQEAKVESVMGAYNRTNGEACCASETLIKKYLCGKWKFDGHFVSDCGAIGDIYKHHRLVETAEEAAALAVKAGCDLNCGDTYPALTEAVKQGLITEAEIDTAVKRLFTTRFRLGMFDPPENVPFAQIPFEMNDCPEHRAAALQAARESIVLLKNDGLLPLEKTLKSVAVIGANANEVEVLLGNYNGTPSKAVTPYEGIKNILPSADVSYVRGCELSGDDTSGLAEAVEAAKNAELAVVVLGLSQYVEGEEGEKQGAGDRVDIALPGVQEKLLQAVHATGTPTVLVLINGSAIAVNWAEANVPAIIEAWYPGEEGGTALAEVIFGDYNPAGRLPVTFNKSVEQLPPFENYDMAGRTYRYMTAEPLYPFGHGLSYTKFKYSALKLSAASVAAGSPVEVSVDVTNTGKRAGDEVVQLYITDVQASVPVPVRQLAGFARISLNPGQKQRVSFNITPEQMSIVDDTGRRIVEPGAFEVTAGGGQPLDGVSFVSGKFDVTGNTVVIE